MAEKKDYYKILGVDRNASENDIKKAFKKASLKWHPDRWANKSEKEQQEAAEKFKDINYAYQVLSDPQKKENYDRFGNEDAGGGSPFGGGGFEDVFSQFFGGGSPFGSFFGGGGPGRSERMQKGQDAQMRIPLTIEEVFSGCTKKVRFNRNVRCANCHGAGGTGMRQCPDCHGTGFKTVTQRIGPQILQSSSPCRRCDGSGHIIEKQCPTCHGKGFTQQPFTIEVTFPAGVPDGATIRLSGQGHEAKTPNNSMNGDFFATAQYSFTDNEYMIDGLDVIQVVEIPYYDLLLGCDYTVELPNKKKKKISIPSCIEEGRQIKLFREGITSKSGQVGDYYIEIHYAMPKKLSASERKAIESIKVEKTKEKYK